MNRDITYCVNTKCKSKDKCLRYINPKEAYGRYWSFMERKHSKCKDCIYFIKKE